MPSRRTFLNDAYLHLPLRRRRRSSSVFRFQHPLRRASRLERRRARAEDVLVLLASAQLQAQLLAPRLALVALSLHPRHALAERGDGLQVLRAALARVVARAELGERRLEAFADARRARGVLGGGGGGRLASGREFGDVSPLRRLGVSSAENLRRPRRRRLRARASRSDASRSAARRSADAARPSPPSRDGAASFPAAARAERSRSSVTRVSAAARSAATETRSAAARRVSASRARDVAVSTAAEARLGVRHGARARILQPSKLLGSLVGDAAGLRLRPRLGFRHRAREVRGGARGRCCRRRARRLFRFPRRERRFGGGLVETRASLVERDGVLGAQPVRLRADAAFRLRRLGAG